jgi:hypothetical protein
MNGLPACQRHSAAAYERQTGNAGAPESGAIRLCGGGSDFSGSRLH